MIQTVPATSDSVPARRDGYLALLSAITTDGLDIMFSPLIMHAKFRSGDMDLGPRKITFLEGLEYKMQKSILLDMENSRIVRAIEWIIKRREEAMLAARKRFWHSTPRAFMRPKSFQFHKLGRHGKFVIYEGRIDFSGLSDEFYRFHGGSPSKAKQAGRSVRKRLIEADTPSEPEEPFLPYMTGTEDIIV